MISGVMLGGDAHRGSCMMGMKDKGFMGAWVVEQMGSEQWCGYRRGLVANWKGVGRSHAW